MRISDWSSDVCSSDLLLPPFRGGGEGRIDHVGAHDHAGATPEGGVVHAAVFIAREVPDVQNVERPEPTLQGLAGQAETQRPREHLRKERDRKSTRLNSSHYCADRMQSSA